MNKILNKLAFVQKHVGFLFYIQSSNDLDVEFISGTPERLFSIVPESSSSSSSKKENDIDDDENNIIQKKEKWAVRYIILFILLDRIIYHPNTL